MKKKFQIASDLKEVQKTSASVLELLKGLTTDESHLFDIRLCLEEALINAIKHGNHSKLELPVTLTVECEPTQIRFEVCDQGEGFDPGAVADCTKEENIFKNKGRGVFLIRNLMDEVRYNPRGNCLTMTKRLTK